MLVTHNQACEILGCSAPTLRKYLHKVQYYPVAMAVETPRGKRWAMGISGAALDKVRAALQRGRPSGVSTQSPITAEEYQVLLDRIEALEARSGGEPTELFTVQQLAENWLHLNPYTVRRHLKVWGRALAKAYRERYDRSPTTENHQIGGKAMPVNTYPADDWVLGALREIVGMV